MKISSKDVRIGKRNKQGIKSGQKEGDQMYHFLWQNEERLRDSDKIKLPHTHFLSSTNKRTDL